MMNSGNRLDFVNAVCGISDAFALGMIIASVASTAEANASEVCIFIGIGIGLVAAIAMAVANFVGKEASK